jgi:hypothetical protein
LNKQQAKQQTKTKVGKKQYLPIYSELPYSFNLFNTTSELVNSFDFSKIKFLSIG